MIEYEIEYFDVICAIQNWIKLLKTRTLYTLIEVRMREAQSNLNNHTVLCGVIVLNRSCQFIRVFIEKN